jgi:NodT family efflux transporter outer membrane factor (OMF) lipoprotein
MHFSYKSAGQAFIIILLLASLNACLVGPDFKPTVPPKVKHYTEPPWPCSTVNAPGHGGASQHFVRAGNVPPQWWHSFQSKKLNKLVCRGLSNSPNLMAAKAVLRQAQENLNAGIGGLYPAFTAQLSAQRGSSTGVFSSNIGDTSVTSSNTPLGRVFNLFNASVNVSYLLDIFGGTRREIEALKARVDYQDYEWKAAYLTLTGNIVTSTIALASLQTQICVTKQLIAEQEEQLQIIQQQFDLGAASGMDVLAQKTQVAQTRATLPPLEKSKEQTRHALAVLVGSLPSCSHIPSINLSELKLPTRLPLSIPSTLVRHRPDVRAAEALWKAANAQVGVATANLYPQFSINGTFGDSNSTGNQLFSSQSKLWSIGAGLLQPLFKGGALIAQRRAAFAAYDQAGAQYQQVILQAFQNVADTLRALEADARELRAQKQAELAARANLDLTRQQFKLGGVSYLSLLDAQRQYQQTRISLIQAQASRYTDTAALYQALGGGWWNC